jgi:hypothetical protein
MDDGSVDAAMACVTIHHWADRAAGLAEMRRVARGPVVVFTFELDDLPEWQRDHFGGVIEQERDLFASAGRVAAELGGNVRVERMPTPADCVDGFVEAFWNRPEAFLDPAVRASQSHWERIGLEETEPILARLAAELESGEWDARHGCLREMAEYEGALRLVISEP